jgi:hypothetical protein
MPVIHIPQYVNFQVNIGSSYQQNFVKIRNPSLELLMILRELEVKKEIPKMELQEIVYSNITSKKVGKIIAILQELNEGTL